jgi:hypothetical protein
LLAIVFVLWIRIAHRDACTTTSPALGARRAATQEGAVDMDSNASRAGEVERNVRRDNDFLSCAARSFKTLQLVVFRSGAIWGLSLSGRLGQGCGSSAVEARPAVLSRWRHRRL